MLKTRFYWMTLAGVFASPSMLPAGEPAKIDLPPMPHAVSSFGAVADNGYLYIYGGHAGKTHSYDTKSVLGTFHRLQLNGGTKWEELPGGPIAQGLNLAAHRGKIYRVGGMQPRNAPGQPADNHSLADCAAFDPQTKRWKDLPSLPAPRSSHDVVVVGDSLVVVGGWQLRGRGESPLWHDTTAILDLAAEKPQWKTIPQPFRRRALTAAAIGSQVYVMGGLSADGPDQRVDILDLTTGQWKEGPAIPGKDRVAFSPAACAVGGHLILSTSDGAVYRLNPRGNAWEKVAESTQQRMVARLVPWGQDRVILLGGAKGGANTDSLEVITLPAPQRPLKNNSPG
jgi:N-acetylneuraminic acid mutarotase